MRIDLYTKIVLTVIAVCLVLLVGKIIGKTNPQKIQSVYVTNRYLSVDGDVRVRSSDKQPVYVEVVNPW